MICVLRYFNLESYFKIFLAYVKQRSERKSFIKSDHNSGEKKVNLKVPARLIVILLRVP